MALSAVYTTGTVWRKDSNSNLALVATKTIDELYPSTNMEFDTSVLVSNGSTSQFLNNGSMGTAGNTKKTNNNAGITDGEPNGPIEFLGTCLIYGVSWAVAFNLTRQMTYTREGISGNDWSRVQNARFVIDGCSYQQGGQTATSSWSAFNYSTYKSQCYHFHGAVARGISFRYVNTGDSPSASGDYTTTSDMSTITGDNAKRLVSVNTSVRLSSYTPTMSDNTSVEWTDGIPLWYVFKINGEYIFIKFEDGLIHNTPGYWENAGKTYFDMTGQESDRVYLTIGDTDNSGNTNGTLATSDERWVARGFGGWKGNVWANWFVNYYYTLNLALYTINSSGFRWNTSTNNLSTAAKFRQYVALGKMDDAGIVSHTEWLVGETAIQNSDNPNKGGSYDDIPERSGGGGGDDDDPSDDQSWGGAYSGAGAFSNFYLCTITDLANLRTWFGGGGSGDPIPDGFDPMGQVLGLLQYPLSISGTALAPDEITFRSGKTIIHTGVNADRSTGGFLHLDCGSVEIPRRMQERGVPFLDFETTLEIYVPFCGTAPLDVQTCVGKTLTCDMYVATTTGDVSAVIAAGGHPVAYMSGNMAESLPISSAGYGMYLAACKSTWGNGVSQVLNQITGGTTDTIKNVNQAALNETLSYGQTGGWGRSELIAESYNNPTVGRNMANLASAKGAAAIGLIKTGLDVANAASTSYEQYQRVKHASYTSVSGSFTSCAAWNYPFTPYVKITRPHKQIPTGGRGDYKHTAAIPLVGTRTLSGAPGLTTCVNPDVSGITNATAQEKDIIYRALVNGVIV